MKYFRSPKQRGNPQQQDVRKGLIEEGLILYSNRAKYQRRHYILRPRSPRDNRVVLPICTLE